MKKFIYSYYITVVCFLLGSLNASGQVHTLTLGNITPCIVGDSISVPITVTNFTNVGAISLQVQFNTTVLTYGSMTSVHAQVPGMLAGSFGNLIGISFSSLSPANIGDGQTLCVLRFKWNGGSAPITFDITNCELADDQANPYALVNYINGSVAPGGTTPTITANGPTTFCQGGSVILTASAGTSYLWSPGGETTQGITVTTSGSYSVNVSVSGCAGNSVPTVVTVNSAPVSTITAGGPTTFCVGGSVTLTASAGSGYLWSPGGETTQNITVNATGSHSVTVTDANNCSNTSSSTSVTVNSNPTANITAGGPTTFCAGGSVTLMASAANSYLWSPGSETTQSIIVSATGSYSVTVTDANNCSNTSSPTLVTENPLPAASISPGGPTAFCAGGNVTLTSSAGSNYLWSPGGETTQSINVNTSGNYSVTVTDANNCSNTSSATTVTVNSLPPATITAGGPTTFCSGGSVTLTASGASSYLWSPGGETTQNITVSTSGSYSVTITDANNCSNTSSATVVTVNALPAASISAGGSTTFCDGGSVLLTASAGSSYLWTPNGETTQNITVNASGSYSVTVTDANNCSNTSSATVVTVNPLPTASITAGGSTTFCSGGSVTLTSSAGSSYVWSPGGETSQSILVSTSGSYSVTVTDASNCSNSSSVTVVTVNTLPTADITANGPTSFCAGGSVTLTASAGSSYLWSPGGETTQNILVTTSGVYAVQVTGANGCSATSAGETVTVISNPSTPTISASGPLTFCDGSSVTLTSSSSSLYTWSPGGETTQSIVVSTSGSYSVTVGSGGCSATSANTVVTVNPTPAAPVITSGGPTTFCAGGSVTLSSSAASSYVWAPGGETTQNITVSTSGNYSVTITDVNNCSGTSASTTVTVIQPLAASISLNGPAIFCTGGNVTLTASSGFGFLWSPGGETSQSIQVSASGSYSVTVTDANNCSSTSPATVVTVNTLPSVSISAGGPTTFCAGGSVTLTSSTGTSYTWSPSGETTQNITVSASGNYSVTITDANNCSNTSAQTTVTVNPLPLATVSAGGPITFCSGGSVTLTSSAGTSYSWTPNGETTQNITVSASGSYGVTVTDANNCSNISSATVVTVNPLPTASITAGGSTTFCSGGSVTFTSSAGSSYVWSPGGETSQSILVSTSGSYSVTVTDASNCSNSSSVTVVTVNTLPTADITANGPTSFCAGGSVTLTASAGSSYLWSPGGETTQNILVTTSGVYAVQVTGANGCSATSAGETVTVISNPSTPTISASGPLTFCDGSSVTLTSSASSLYTWSPGGETTQSIVVSTSGSYSVTVGAGGCSATSANTAVTVNPTPAAPVITAGGPTTFCAGGSVILASTSASSYMWSPGGETTQSISVSTTGFYSVEITDGNNCTNVSSTISVNVNPLPSVSITAGGPTAFCDGGSVMLTASAGSSYSWTPNGETTQNITVSASGSYGVTVTDANNCSNTSSATIVTVNPLPVASITASGPTTFCSGGSVTLTSTAGSSYLWSPGGETSQSILVSTSGNYAVSITDVNNCSGTSSPVSVTVNPLPVAAILPGGPLTFCAGGSVMLTASSAVGYLWSPNGETTQDITVTASGTYSVTITDANNCSGSSAPVTVTVNPLPVATISASGSLTFCDGDDVTLTATAASTYLWSPGGETTQNITVSSAGSFSVTITDANNCSNSSGSVTVVVNPLPSSAITANGPTTFCNGGSVTLCAPAPGTYMWSNTATTQCISVLTGGTYSVTVTDLNNCSSTSSEVVTVHAPVPTPTITSNNPVCGPVTLTSNFSAAYNWFPGGETTQSITIVSVGSFNVSLTVEDIYGCMSNATSFSGTVVACGPTLSCVTPDQTQTSNVQVSEATVSWNPLVTGTSFKVRYYEVSNPTIDFYKNSTINTVVLDNLKPNTSYEWEVRTVCANFTPYSAPVLFVTQSGLMPCGSTPQDPTTTVITPTSAQLNWIPVVATNFKIRYHVASTTAYKYVNISGTNPSGYNLTGLLPSTTYKWRVNALCASQWSGYSLEVTFVTPAGSLPCGYVPYDLLVSNITANTAQLNWNPAVTGDQFKARYSTLSPTSWKYKTVSGVPNVSAMTLVGLNPNTSYKYQIQTLCNTGPGSSYSPANQFLTQAIPAREIGNAVTGNLHVYPNPANSNVTVDFNSDTEQNITLRITDLSGRILMSIDVSAAVGVNAQYVDLKGLSSGLYILTLSGHDTNINIPLSVY